MKFEFAALPFGGLERSPAPFLFTMYVILGSIFSMSAKHGFGQANPIEDGNKEYISEIQQWQKTNEERFKDPFGWLALIGNFWLHEGENRIGFGDSNIVKLPEDFSGKPTGSFVLKGGSVEIRLDSQSVIQVNGETEGNIRLTIDSSRIESDGKDVILLGQRVKLQLVRRNGRFAVRVRDRQNHAFEEFQGKKWYEVRPEFRVEAIFTPYEPTRTIPIVNVKGDTVDTEVVGYLSFRIRDREYQLDAFSESPESLIIVFKDLTSGKTTYTPGRFLEAPAPKNGRVLLDFNKAYNPPCAFTPHALCPLPPKQNYLDVEIVAGELKID